MVWRATVVFLWEQITREAKCNSTYKGKEKRIIGSKKYGGGITGRAFPKRIVHNSVYVYIRGEASLEDKENLRVKGREARIVQEELGMGVEKAKLRHSPTVTLINRSEQERKTLCMCVCV